MKKLEFTTGKGRFVVVDVKDIDYDVLGINGEELDKIDYLDELSEEQALEIVDSIEYDENYKLFYDYLRNEWVTSAIKSLHSLIKSKGWYLSNPAPLLSHHRLEAESRTLHNPVIFKIK